MLRKYGVVGRFVEFCGVGLSNLGLADRATIANMAPEYGATASLFPVDAITLEYLEVTGRPAEAIRTVEAYCKEQGLFRTDETPDPTYNDLLELDLGSIVPSMAGPRRPQDRVAIEDVQATFRAAYADRIGTSTSTNGSINGAASATGPGSANGSSRPAVGGGVAVQLGPATGDADPRLGRDRGDHELHPTRSNPSVMLGAVWSPRRRSSAGWTCRPTSRPA
jgi:aconitate hydratase